MTPPSPSLPNAASIRALVNKALPPSTLRDAVYTRIARARRRNEMVYTIWSRPYQVAHYFLRETLRHDLGLSFTAAGAIATLLLSSEEHDQP